MFFFTVKYLNSATNIVLIRVKRGLHKLVQSSMVFVKNIGSVDAFLRTLHLGGRYSVYRSDTLIISKSAGPEKQIF